MKKVPKISEAEWQVMKLLWTRHPLTANKIVELLSSAKSWKPKTVKTLLNRLVNKKALGYKTKGREYHYYPLVSEADCARVESRSFLERVYGGAVTPMLAAFIENGELTTEEIKELKQILERKGRS